MQTASSHKFEIGTQIRHSSVSSLSGTITGKCWMDEGGRISHVVPAYEVKNGRRRFVIAEGSAVLAP